MNTEVFLVCPSYGRPYGTGRRPIKHGGAPLGLACINGLLKSAGYRTRLLDLDFSEWTDQTVVECIAAERPRFLGLTAVTTQVLSAVRLARAVKAAAPEVTTLLGGPHPSALPELTASYPGVDLVVSGEGEGPMLELLRGRPYAQIPGLTWTEDGVVRTNPRGPLITDLDAQPLPDYTGLEIRHYGCILHRSVFDGPSLPVISARGCPYHCLFCASAAVAQRHCRFLSPVRFVDHLEDLVRRYAIRCFSFNDETFILHQPRAQEICEELLRRDLRITWACMTRVDRVDSEALRMMKQAGCRLIEIGIESGDEPILERMGKGITLAQIREACRSITRAGIRLNGFFILGLPYDTPETVRGTIAFAQELPLDFAQFAMFVPLPGSAGWDLALEGRVLRMYAQDWDDFSRYAYPLVESEALTREQLQALHQAALRQFYYRPKRIARWVLDMSSPRRLRNLFDLVTAFFRVAGANRQGSTTPPRPQVTRARLDRLIGTLGQRLNTDSVPCSVSPLVSCLG